MRRSSPWCRAIAQPQSQALARSKRRSPRVPAPSLFGRAAASLRCRRRLANMRSISTREGSGEVHRNHLFGVYVAPMSFMMVRLGGDDRSALVRRSFRPVALCVARCLGGSEAFPWAIEHPCLPARPRSAAGVHGLRSGSAASGTPRPM